MSARRPRRSRGFTLLEVMLAFVLLAAAMAVLLTMLSDGLRLVGQARNETEATLYAQSLLDGVGVLEPIRASERQGVFGNGRYRYRLAIAEVDDPVPPPEPEPGAASPAPAAEETVDGPKLFRIALLVTWGAGLPAQRLELVTLRARADDGSDEAAP